MVSKVLTFLVVVVSLSGVAAWAAGGFRAQTRLGAAAGDQWEPSVAADTFRHIYVLYPQYTARLSCHDCFSPAMELLMSNDNGQTWEQPRPILPADSRQFDAQIAVDGADGRTVYASWLQHEKRDIVVAKSADFGQSWSVVVAWRSASEADKPVLAVRGGNILTAFSEGRNLSVAVSHDGGVTFRPSLINAEFGLGWAQAGGATIDGEGNAFVAWASYVRSGPGKGAAALYVSKSEDGGASWSTRLLDTSMAAPGCERFKCGWGYLGAQIAMTSDGAGTLYALWNAGRTAYGAQKIYFSSSTTAGDTWSAKSAIANAGAGTEQAFPAVVAGDAGDVRIAWMDKRRGLLWNTYYRSSTNGGASWSAVVKLSGYRRGYRYIHRGGFDFPFGDYFGLAIDGDGNTQAAWGEGLNFDSPGSIWYASGR